MYVPFIIIFILIMLIMFQNCSCDIKEKFITEQSQEQGYVHKPDIMIDPSFSDVIIYNNDDNPYADGQKNGVTKCAESCKGQCVEFGITGISFCFPERK